MSCKVVHHRNITTVLLSSPCMLIPARMEIVQVPFCRTESAFHDINLLLFEQRLQCFKIIIPKHWRLIFQRNPNSDVFGYFWLNINTQEMPLWQDVDSITKFRFHYLEDANQTPCLKSQETYLVVCKSTFEVINNLLFTGIEIGSWYTTL